jgi:hypothetical protein
MVGILVFLVLKCFLSLFLTLNSVHPTPQDPPIALYLNNLATEGHAEPFKSLQN